jgi:DNA-binding transcriptional MerR regulator
MATQLSQKRAYDPPAAIPDRLYFKIGDVARICGLETYVLRFWETEFPQLKPNKSGTGQRLYRRRDVELVLEIKRLVHAEGYTLAGARQALDQSSRRGPRRATQVTALPDSPLGPQLAAQTDSQSRLPLMPADGAQQRLDAVASVIGHARAELRELAGQLASPAPRPPRRRTRLATVPHTSESLFPDSAC